MGTPHAHGHHDRRRLTQALALIAAFMVAEVVGAALAGSLALLADAGHMLTDAGALGGALWANRLAERPASPRWSYGLKRAEILAAGLNGVTLLVIAVLIGYAAIRHLVSPPVVHGGVLVVLAGVGIVVNVAAAGLLHHTDRASLNVRGALAHVRTDLYAFLATGAAGLVILFAGYERADPVASLVAVVLMLRAAGSLLATSGRVLLEGTPESVDLDEVRRHLLSLAEVLEVHEVHAWTLTSALPVVSAHVVVSDACLTSGRAGRLLDDLQGCLAGHFDVAHSTFQIEPATHVGHELPEHA